MFNPTHNTNSGGDNNGALLRSGSNLTSGAMASFGLGNAAAAAPNTSSIIPANVKTGSVTLRNNRLQVTQVIDPNGRVKLPVYYRKIKEIEETLITKLVSLKIVAKINDGSSTGVFLPRFSCCLVEMRFGYPVFFYEVKPHQGMYVTNPQVSAYRKYESELADAVGYPVQVRRDTRIPNFPIYIVVALCNDPAIFRYIGLPLSNGGSITKLPSSTANKPATATTTKNNIELTVAPKELPNKANLRDYLDFDKIFDENWQLNLLVGLDKSGLIAASVYKLDHNIVAGKTNSGKSNLLLGIAAQPLIGELQKPLASGRQRANLVLVDVRGVTFNRALFKDLPFVYNRHILTEDDEIIHLFNDLQTEMDKRGKLLELTHCQNLAEYNDLVPEHLKRPVIMVFIEEFSELIENMQGKLNKPLKTVIKVCRKFGIYFYLGGPSFKADIVDSDVVNNSSRWVLGELDSDSARVLTMGSLRPSKILAGRGVYKFDGRDTEFQSFYLAYTDFTNMVNHLRVRYGLAPVERPTKWDDSLEINKEVFASPFDGHSSSYNIGNRRIGGNSDFSSTGNSEIPSKTVSFQSGNSEILTAVAVSNAGNLEKTGNLGVSATGNFNNLSFQRGNSSGNFSEISGDLETISESEAAGKAVNPAFSEISAFSVSEVIDGKAVTIWLSPENQAKIIAMMLAGNGKTEIKKEIGVLSGGYRDGKYKAYGKYYDALYEIVKPQLLATKEPKAEIGSNGRELKTEVELTAPQPLASAPSNVPAQSATYLTENTQNQEGTPSAYLPIGSSGLQQQPQNQPSNSNSRVLQVAQPTLPQLQAASQSQAKPQSKKSLVEVEISGRSMSFETAFVYNVIPDPEDEEEREKSIDLAEIGRRMTKLNGWVLYPRRYQDVEDKLGVLIGMQLIEQDDAGYYYRI